MIILSMHEQITDVVRITCRTLHFLLMKVESRIRVELVRTPNEAIIFYFLKLFLQKELIDIYRT